MESIDSAGTYVNLITPKVHEDEYRYKLKYKIYSDQTSRFPYTSSRGNQYIIVICDPDYNVIVVEPLKRCHGAQLAETFNKCCNKLKLKQRENHLFILDNKCPKEIQSTINSLGGMYQLFPPQQHHRNAAEADIRTFKNHSLSGLATCDPQLPIAEWDCLLPQTELTLNFLRNSKINPKLSAWAHLNGMFTFNKTPLLPPGTKILVHSKPTYHKEFHGQQGWYVAPAPYPYRCMTCYIPSKHREIVSDTIKIIPNYVPIP